VWLSHLSPQGAESTSHGRRSDHRCRRCIVATPDGMFLKSVSEELSPSRFSANNGFGLCGLELDDLAVNDLGISRASLPWFHAASSAFQG
jgi:hypothetical protein